MSHHRLLTAAGAAALACASLGLAACGSGEDTSGAPSTPQTGSAETAPEGTEGSGGGPTTGPAPASATPVVTSAVVATFAEPTALVVRPGDDHLWVAERAGTIRRVTVGDDGTLAPAGEPVLDLTDETTTDSERGLLGLAFAEDGSSLFASYTNLEGDTRLVSYAIEDDAVDEASRTVLLAQEQPYPNHNGGHVVLGPDGMLWFGLGDGGAGDDPENRAQDPDTLLGKMLRIDPAGGDPEIVISGIRNPWRFSFDTDGSLWIGDVGQNRWEEVDHLPADAIDGANLGWSGLEGTRENPNVDPDGRTGEDPVAPVFEYEHTDGNCSITGGFVYRGDAISDLEGAYLFADYCAGRVRAIRLDDAGAFDQEYDLALAVASPISFAADADGEPLVLSADGTVTRILPGP